MTSRRSSADQHPSDGTRILCVLSVSVSAADYALSLSASTISELFPPEVMQGLYQTER